MNTLVGFNIHRGCLALAARPQERDCPTSTWRMSRALILKASTIPTISAFSGAAAFGVELIVLGPHAATLCIERPSEHPWRPLFKFRSSRQEWPHVIATLRGVGFTVVPSRRIRPRNCATALPSHASRTALCSLAPKAMG
jgi:hypothetical protein